MKTKLIALALCLSCLAGYAQTVTGTSTPSPNAGTFLDGTLSIPQRITLASAVVSGSDSTPYEVTSAAGWMLGARPVGSLLAALPSFADSVVADPTMGGRASDTSLFAGAVLWKVDSTARLDDKIALLSDKIPSSYLSPSQTVTLKARYGVLLSHKARSQCDAQNYVEAIATATPGLGCDLASNADVIFDAKLALQSPDIKSWAKLIFLITDWQHTQKGIDTWCSACKLSGNLVDSQAFIAHLKTGAGVNQLSGVPLPSVPLSDVAGPLATRNLINNLILSEDYAGALSAADRVFAKAPSGSPLSSAMALRAQCLRNRDGDLLNANAYVNEVSAPAPK